MLEYHSYWGKRKKEERKGLTDYKAGDLNGWQEKITRILGLFVKPQWLVIKCHCPEI